MNSNNASMIRLEVSMRGDHTKYHEKEEPRRPNKKEREHSRMLAHRRQRRVLLLPELRQTNPTAVHRHAQQRQLELHPPVLEHPPPLDLDGAGERHVRLLLRRRGVTMRRTCGPDDLGDEEQVLRGDGGVSG